MPTIVCPLCGTQQENAWDCAACGHPLHERPALQVQVDAFPDLEATRVDAGGNVALEIVPGLEATSQAAADAPDVALPELEPTALGAALAVPAESVPGLEATALAPAGEPTPAAQVACRYCATPWDPAWGIFCPRCGMRVPAVQALPRAERAGAREAELRSCPSCGTPRQRVGDPCTGCGQKVVMAALP